MIVHYDNYTQFNIGAKAQRLFKMKENGINVPDFFCITANTDISEACEYVKSKFSEDTLFSIRSSASAEDGANFSFAGQLDTFLFVKYSDISSKIAQCRASAESSGINEYLSFSGISQNEFSMTVIVQVMIDAELSGVLFTANPQGIINETVITVGRGTGDNVVEDKVPVTTYYCNHSDGTTYAEISGDSPVLETRMLTELLSISAHIRQLFGCECDIEYAIKNNCLYILQARPITTLHTDKHIILDSSNISESYPDISMPMTISFVNDVYHLVFSSLVRRITRNDGTCERLDSVLSKMTDSANGRIYYRISSWYDVIAMLPFSKKIIPVWQEMLGVSDKSVTQSAEPPQKSTKFRVLLSFIQYMSSNERRMKELNRYFDEVYPKFRERIETTDSPEKLFEIYSELKDALASRWDVTLINDMYSFIFTALLKRKLASIGVENPEDSANRMICGSDLIESMKPVKLLSEIRDTLENEKLSETFFAINDTAEFEHFLEGNSHSSQLISRYIDEFGDRCPCELKLESETYRTNPLLFIGTAANFSEMPKSSNLCREKLHGLAKIYAKKAYNGIMLREKSRMSRGRIFGLIREIILRCGRNFAENGLISSQRDIFFLTFDELENAAKGNSSDLKNIISNRRKEWDSFAKLPAYTRIIFDREVFDKHPSDTVSDLVCGDNPLIFGTPCSSGIVEGEILRVTKPDADTDTSDKIILAEMTDPGWIFAVSQSLGIISKKGSLLSHTAIISRELNKPAVVGVGNACNNLKNGDYVRLNGTDGTVQLIRRSSDIKDSTTSKLCSAV